MNDDEEDYPIAVSKGRRRPPVVEHGQEILQTVHPKDAMQEQEAQPPTVVNMADTMPTPSDDDDAPLLTNTGLTDDDDTAFLVSHPEDEEPFTDDEAPTSPATVKSRRRKRQRESSSDDGASSDGSEGIASGQVVSSSRDRDRRAKLIGQVLARWWHVLPEWPPQNFDYAAELQKRKLRQVSFDDWELEDDVDNNGITKVYQITHYEGMFRDPSGGVIDLRPEEGKPCFKNLSRYTDIELYQMLITALKNQIRELDDSPYLISDSMVVDRLRDDLNRETRVAMQALTRLEKA